MKNTIISVVILIIVALAGYWVLTRPVPPQAPADTGTQQAANPAVYQDGYLLLGADTDAGGKHLIAYNAMTLYTFSKDSNGTSACTGACAANWPPYIVGSVDALANIQAGITGKVSSITRDDGSLQVTYNGAPLYFWVKDTQPGDATGDGINGFALARP
jgi:predicted lipoprotein with Yx(FWY)xxD motif